MISAFGVIHKGSTKMQGKVLRAFNAQPWGPGMQERMRANYLAGRLHGGQQGKEFSQASLKAVRNMNRRRGRILP